MGTGAPPADVVFSVYFEGTAYRIEHQYTHVALLFYHTEAADLSDPVAAAALPDPPPPQLKIGFDGTGAVAGLRGSIFGRGLDGQVERACEVVRRLLLDPGRRVRVNAVGLSRGGVGALLLARAMGSGPLGKQSHRLDLNILLLDPVPGNLVSTSRVPAPAGLARKVRDLRGACTLRSALALYPHVPLPTLYFHAPVLPAYPGQCRVEEEATLGEHQYAFLPRAFFDAGDGACPPGAPLPCLRDEGPGALASAMSYLRCREWLGSVGTRLRHGHPTALGVPRWLGGAVGPEEWAAELERRILVSAADELRRSGPEGATQRDAHGGGSVRRRPGPARWLSPHHAAIAQRHGAAPGNAAEEEYLLYIKRRRPLTEVASDSENLSSGLPG